MLHLVLAEASLEKVPLSLFNHPQVVSYCRKRKIKPKEAILDTSYHFEAVKKLPFKHKRGRPDIVHFFLLLTQDSLVNKVGKLRTYIHTLNNEVIYVNPGTRPPKHYDRFLGLMQQLFKEGQVPPKKEALFLIKKKNLADLKKEINPDITIGLSRKGKVINPFKYFGKINKEKSVAVIVGGFPHGNFCSETLEVIDQLFSLGNYPLQTWTVTSLVLCSYCQSLLHY